MNKLSSLLPLLLCCCSSQNQLILDPFDKGESLMIRDEEAIQAFESIMAGVKAPENEYKATEHPSDFFDSLDVLSTTQYTQPILGICRYGEKEYYYHIEKDTRGNMITDLDQGVAEFIVTPETYTRIREFIVLHSPAKQAEQELDEPLNESDMAADKAE